MNYWASLIFKRKNICKIEFVLEFRLLYPQWWKTYLNANEKSKVLKDGAKQTADLKPTSYQVSAKFNIISYLRLQVRPQNDNQINVSRSVLPNFTNLIAVIKICSLEVIAFSSFFWMRSSESFTVVLLAKFYWTKKDLVIRTYKECRNSANPKIILVD